MLGKGSSQILDNRGLTLILILLQGALLVLQVGILLNSIDESIQSARISGRLCPICALNAAREPFGSTLYVSIKTMSKSEIIKSCIWGISTRKHQMWCPGLALKRPAKLNGLEVK